MIQLSVPLLLASGSPRRKEILAQAGFAFEVKVKNTEEIYPNDLLAAEVPQFLAKLKASAFEEEASSKIVITSDTVVILENTILGKPAGPSEAIQMLKYLSGKVHDVVSGVCIKYQHREIIFSDTSKVHFKAFSDQEIEYYIEKYKPFDKAGSYGVQEWIGMIGIERMEGSFYNVMGLPIHLVYKELLRLNSELG